MLRYLLLFSFWALFSAEYINAQCYPDRHSTLKSDHWISCEESANPNIERGDSYWLMYDFSISYALTESTIWNCNVYNETINGMQDIFIDYSEDGIEWTEWGIFTIPQANATSFYEGVEGPNFEGINARFVLITMLNNYGGDCACLSEIRFQTSGNSVSNETLNELNLQASIQPNPADEQTIISINSQIDFFDGKMELINLTGQNIWTRKISLIEGENNFDINTADLTDGQYFINIYADDGFFSQKLIIQHNK